MKWNSLLPISIQPQFYNSPLLISFSKIDFQFRFTRFIVGQTIYNLLPLRFIFKINV